MKLPNKEDLLQWRCEPVIQRLMSENRWSHRVAEQWFQDFMCWIYSSQSWKLEHDTPFVMDGLHYLDDVWHAYILHTKLYFEMCKKLFDVDYLHHEPAAPFVHNIMNSEEFRVQLIFILNEWGEEYIDRVWLYGADVSDIVNGDMPAYAV